MPPSSSLKPRRCRYPYLRRTLRQGNAPSALPSFLQLDDHGLGLADSAVKGRHHHLVHVVPIRRVLVLEARANIALASPPQRSTAVSSQGCVIAIGSIDDVFGVGSQLSSAISKALGVRSRLPTTLPACRRSGFSGSYASNTGRLVPVSKFVTAVVSVGVQIQHRSSSFVFTDERSRPP